jgi:hypothetical protein
LWRQRSCKRQTGGAPPTRSSRSRSRARRLSRARSRFVSLSCPCLQVRGFRTCKTEPLEFAKNVQAARTCKFFASRARRANMPHAPALSLRLIEGIHHCLPLRLGSLSDCLTGSSLVALSYPSRLQVLCTESKVERRCLTHLTFSTLTCWVRGTNSSNLEPEFPQQDGSLPIW